MLFSLFFQRSLLHILQYFCSSKINEDMVVGSVVLVVVKENLNFAFGSDLEMCQGGSFLRKTSCTFLQQLLKS